VLGFDWAHGADVATIIDAGLMAVTVIGGFWAAITQIPKLVNHAHVVAERNRLREENKHLHSTIGVLTSTVSAYHGLRAEMDALTGRIDSMEDLQIDSIEYIALLIQHMRAGGTADTMPPIPDVLRAEVLEQLRTRGKTARATRSLEAP
jgi:hypothetical protein